MIYVYDILLNFSDDILFEFYEWNNSDSLDNMKKIKLAKIKKEFFDDLLNYKIKVENNFLNDIFNTCEIYKNRGSELLNYCILLTDGNRVVGVEFNNDGYIMCMSKMLLDEEEEVLALADNLELIDIKYKIFDKTKVNRFLTRKELKIKKYLLSEANNAYKTKNFDKLNFMYTELFELKNICDKDKLKEIINSMDISLNKNHFNLYEMLRLSNKKKQV